MDNFLLPITMLLFGCIYYKYPPKKIGKGYKSTMSIKNFDTWDFAQKLFGINFIIFGSLSILIVSLITFLQISFIFNFEALLFLICIIINILVTEIYLRLKFDNEGNIK